jgi:integral membrane protein
MTKAKAIRSFRIIAILEGISYLALFITMPLKYWAEMPMPNYIVGMAHGGLFIAYCVFLLICWIKFEWKFIEALKLFIASLVPFGTFYMDSKFLKHKDAALNEPNYGR